MDFTIDLDISRAKTLAKDFYLDKDKIIDTGYSVTREQGTHHFLRIICEFINS